MKRSSTLLLAWMVVLSLSACMAQLDEEGDPAEEEASLTDEPEARALLNEPETWPAASAAELAAKGSGAGEAAASFTNCTFGGPSGCGTKGGYCCGDLICCGPTQGCCMDHQGPYCSWDPCP